MKNAIIAIILLAIGLALGMFFPFGGSNARNASFHETSGQSGQRFHGKAKNIILMVGDGMGLTQIYAGMTANKGKLHLERCKQIGFSKTYSSNAYITDSAAGATAFSIGKKTYNGAVGLGSDSLPYPTILEIAEQHGLATGMVATSQISHATPASFIGHQIDRHMFEEIASDFLKTDIDVFIGGGTDDFTKREDGRNLMEELKAKGYQTALSMDQVRSVKSGKLAALLAPVGMPKYSEGRGDMLAESSLKAIDLLSTNEKGFFLMIEGSQIDWAGHENDLPYLIDEMLDFDRTIGKVLDFAEKNGETLVIITADHETGGLSLNGGSLEKGEVTAVFTTLKHTAVCVPVFAFGPEAENFMGFYENTSIFDKMMAIFGFTKAQ